jgi:predicted N-acetyltransferase YhbS
MYVKAVGEDRVWVAVDNHDVLGFLEIRPCEIEKLFMRGRWARHGIGSALLRLGIDRIRNACDGSITTLALLNARAFYERHGFIKVGESTIVRGLSRIEIAVVRMELNQPSGHNAA